MTDAKTITHREKQGLTPSATVGPYFAYALTPANYPFRVQFSNALATADVAGERIRIEGCVTDGDGKGIGDAMIEIWQADANGRYAHPADPSAVANSGFKGFGRCEPTADGGYSFDTIKPGAVAGANGMQAPHIVVAVFARGMLRHVYTRIYFADEPATATDAVLALVPLARRKTLIAERSHGGTATYRFDIRIQGADETVFFDL
jgi:protocatechuate 3,4-dioxygenase, alpha subunit